MADWSNVAQAAQWLAEGRVIEHRTLGVNNPTWRVFNNAGIDVYHEYRLSPRTIDIGGVKVNAPILERPKHGNDFVSVVRTSGIHSGLANHFVDADYADGFVFATEADAIAARDAIVRLLTQGAE